MHFVNTKSLLLIGIALVLLWVIKNITTSIITLRQNSHIVTSLKFQEEQAKRKRQLLKQKLHFVNTPEFIEKEAREKLGMVKPGEHIVLAPQILQNQQKISIDSSPNWKKWWKLFF
jgi:cell division protein DivIC